ncbi:hypothetical protein O6H91_13G073600 [Diphasiastrum complanatum]|uniref:Uncharacterized protein n=1 Tax=Diphasiastrum complanatum TaxID=34168 RepID=A0ACC2BW01_DIPCM|nr:hypothetical protein O6H91_13G073600 [Diphasiastrum complanatum]
MRIQVRVQKASFPLAPTRYLFSSLLSFPFLLCLFLFFPFPSFCVCLPFPLSLSSLLPCLCIQPKQVCMVTERIYARVPSHSIHPGPLPTILSSFYAPQFGPLPLALSCLISGTRVFAFERLDGSLIDLGALVLLVTLVSVAWEPIRCGSWCGVGARVCYGRHCLVADAVAGNLNGLVSILQGFVNVFASSKLSLQSSLPAHICVLLCCRIEGLWAMIGQNIEFR